MCIRDRVGDFRTSYPVRFTELVNTYRAKFGYPDMPVIQTQVAGFEAKVSGATESWRDMQLLQPEITNNIENAYTVCNTDLGNRLDIHPPKKKLLGTRAANLACEKFYDIEGVYGTSPYFKSAEKTEDGILITFENVHDKLKTKNSPYLSLIHILTESSLIKLHSPFYNINLKNRGYPFIYYNVEKGFPILRIEEKRTGKGQYFGPFLSRDKVKYYIQLLSRIFKLPDCSLKVRKKKACVNYQMNRCNGYCMGYVDEEILSEISKGICSVLSGDIDMLRSRFLDEMEKAAENLEFEKAADFRDKSNFLEQMAMSQKTVVVEKRHADYILSLIHIF